MSKEAYIKPIQHYRNAKGISQHFKNMLKQIAKLQVETPIFALKMVENEDESEAQRFSSAKDFMNALNNHSRFEKSIPFIEHAIRVITFIPPEWYLCDKDGNLDEEKYIDKRQGFTKEAKKVFHNVYKALKENKASKLVSKHLFDNATFKLLAKLIRDLDVKKKIEQLKEEKQSLEEKSKELEKKKNKLENDAKKKIRAEKNKKKREKMKATFKKRYGPKVKDIGEQMRNVKARLKEVKAAIDGGTKATSEQVSLESFIDPYEVGFGVSLLCHRSIDEKPTDISSMVNLITRKNYSRIYTKMKELSRQCKKVNLSADQVNMTNFYRMGEEKRADSAGHRVGKAKPLDEFPVVSTIAYVDMQQTIKDYVDNKSKKGDGKGKSDQKEKKEDENEESSLSSLNLSSNDEDSEDHDEEDEDEEEEQDDDIFDSEEEEEEDGDGDESEDEKRNNQPQKRRRTADEGEKSNKRSKKEAKPSATSKQKKRKADERISEGTKRSNKSAKKEESFEELVERNMRSSGMIMTQEEVLDAIKGKEQRQKAKQEIDAAVVCTKNEDLATQFSPVVHYDSAIPSHTEVMNATKSHKQPELNVAFQPKSIVQAAFCIQHTNRIPDAIVTPIREDLKSMSLERETQFAEKINTETHCKQIADLLMNWKLSKHAVKSVVNFVCT